MPYTLDYLERTYAIYLNHHKVIHYRDGHPVYSLSTPSAYSKPAANLFARTFYRLVQNRNLPNLMSFAVNDVCNASCAHCSFFSAVEEPGRHVLSLEESKKLIRDAQELGVSVFNFVGGEPLLRRDLPEIIRSVDKDLSTTVMFTNGAFLASRIRELTRAGLDSVYVSIDAANAAMHDMLRGKPGLFDDAMKGIAAALKSGRSVGLSCTLTPETFAAGELDKVVELARKLGVHEVIVFDAMPTGRLKNNAELVDKAAWIEDIITASEKFNRDERYPGVLVYAYATSHRSVGCSCGTSYFYVSPYGDVMSCDFNHAKFGNILEQPLYRIWDRLSTEPDFCKSAWGGCKIKNSSYVGHEKVAAGPNSSDCACH